MHEELWAQTNKGRSTGVCPGVRTVLQRLLLQNKAPQTSVASDNTLVADSMGQEFGQGSAL